MRERERETERERQREREKAGSQPGLLPIYLLGIHGYVGTL